MRHHNYNPDFEFVKEPVEFNKYTDKDLLKYCLGATLYMPATKDFTNAIIENRFPGLTSMVMCCEDAISEEVLPEAEENLINFFEFIYQSLKSGKITEQDVPLFFVRVRSFEQFTDFADKLKPSHVEVLSGFVFPKFTTSNGAKYLSHLKYLNDKFDDLLYGMPILESREIVYKETRTEELIGIKNLLKQFKDIILNIRVGATDFSSIFGVRRGIDYSVYDILPVRDCLSDIINFLNRDDENYVISGPVWEYFLSDKSMKFPDKLESDIYSSLLKRESLVNDAIDGLLREVILDKASGFVGKTIIHPSHLKYVNAMQAVTEEEYEDAKQILDTSGGVIKSSNNNKMNEINPHRNWAEKVYNRAKAYGVIKSEKSYVKLFS